MKILYVGGEALPFASTGGLGDVLGSLPIAMAKADPKNDIRVVIPLHAKIGKPWRDLMELAASFDVHLSWRVQHADVYRLIREGVTYYFIGNDYYFNREKLYGEYDDAERYAFFCKAAVEMLPRIGFTPEILHANDWQAALSIIYLRKQQNYPNTQTVYTIHNIEYQGIYSKDLIGDVFSLWNTDLPDLEYNDCINLTKGAIVCCDKLTTVSKRYSEEIRTPYYAHGLSDILTQYAYKTCGIVNGIDVEYYNPLTDPDMIGQHFSAKFHTFSGKASNKAALQKALGLPEAPDKPLIAMISRLVPHKGLDLVRAVLGEILQGDSQFVVLGTGEPDYEEYFRALEQYYPDKVRALIKFDKSFSKQIYAGADLFLMPSQAEPCGLSQMIASRYGTVPVVRETGGLYDTIQAFNPTTGQGNGVTFYAFHPYEMKDAVGRALALYYDKPLWKKLVRNVMNVDFSWTASANKYGEMYRSLF
jgi:starch synthase